MKIGFLITARLKSTRLPKKIIKDLNGKTVIERIIDRAKEIQGLSEIVLCTSPNPQDAPLQNIAKTNNISYFLGDEDDVLQRLRDAALTFQFDYILGITADNPLFSIQYSNQIVQNIKENKYDFIKIQDLPFGTATYGMNVKALQTVCKVKKIIDTEIWGYLIDRPKIFNITTIQATGLLKRPHYRLTLDYQEDYTLLNHLYTNIPFTTTLDLQNVIQYLDNHPDIAQINKNCTQLDLDEKIKQKIDFYYEKNFKNIMKIKQDIYTGNTV